MHRNVPWKSVCLLALAFTPLLPGAPGDVSFSRAAQSVDAYDFVEITVTVASPDARNPFTDAPLLGSFRKAGATQRTDVEGFCDSPDGSAFRIRFMPSAPGEYSYSITYRQGAFEKSHTGTFHATDGHRRGPIRVDTQYPWHFIWEGTGEHYFFNGTTAYWLMGWSDETVIEAAIERLRRLKVNRMRVTLAGRTNTFYGEAVMVGDAWTVFLAPWPAKMPEDVYHPGFDY